MATNRNSRKPAQPAIEETLAQRGAAYGPFDTHAEITQRLEDIIREYPGYSNLSYSQREALHMTFHKVGRIINGDPNFHDSWHDIVGYNKLVADEILGIKQ